MYLGHFQLDEAPFSITPDPRFVYLSERHRDGLAHLLYGVGQGGSGGFIQLTGEVGTGKTTLVRLLLEQLPEHTEVALVLNPMLNPTELLESICQELRLTFSAGSESLKNLTETLNAHLLKRHAEGWRVIVLIDEAQNLSPESLEQVRLLTNLETSEQKLLQMILVGQPELRTLLDRHDLRQLKQRITARFHLTPLNGAETEEYLQHRLTVAGSTRQLFTRAAARAMFHASEGIPRVINIMADRALLAAYVAGQDRVGASEVKRAAREIRLGEMDGGSTIVWWLAATVVALLLGMSAALYLRPATSSAAATPAETKEPAMPRTPLVEGEPEQQAQAISAGPPLQAELAERIAKASGHADQTWRSWLELYGIADSTLVSAAQRCPDNVDSTLRCARLSGNLAKLAMLNRPVMLKLKANDVIVPGLLLGLNEQSVLLELAGHRGVYARGDFEQHWLGDYLALWQMPAEIPNQISVGAGRVSVRHLRALFESAGLSPPRERVFASKWLEVVREFQLKQGLGADGIVGPETWLLLNRSQSDQARLLVQF